MSHNGTIQALTSEQLPADCYVFKHSTRCPVSSAASEAVERHRWDLPLYWINVIEQRVLSNWVGIHFGIPHESPQLLLIRAGQVVQVVNHGEIRTRIDAEML